MSRPYRSQSGLVGWLQETNRAIVAFDQRRRFRFFNQGAVQLTGCQPADIVGKSAAYTSKQEGTLAERVMSALAPPPEAFEGQECQLTASFVDSHGTSRSIRVQYLPCLDAEGQLLTVLAYILNNNQPTHSLTNQPARQLLHEQLAKLMTEQQRELRESQIIAVSPAMKRVVQQVKMAQTSATPLSLSGPAGSGKSYLSRYISMTRDQYDPVVCLDCHELDRVDQKRILNDVLNQVEADDPRRVLLIDHVEKFPTDLQQRVLEYWQASGMESNLRIVVSSTSQLPALFEQGVLIEEFYFAVSSMTIEVPGLAERTEDFELLIQAFIEEQNHNREIQISGCDQAVLARLQEYSWPGEASELSSVIIEACQNCDQNLITETHLPLRFQSGIGADATMPPLTETFRPIEETLQKIEIEEIERALRFTKGNKAQAATLLGLTRAKFYRRLESLNLGDE